MLSRAVPTLRFSCALAALLIALVCDSIGPANADAATPCGPLTRLPPPVAAIPAGDQHRLPANSVTRHRLDLPGRTLCFTATAGTIQLPSDGSGQTPAAEVAYISYTLDGADPRGRPVTFALNGGPGIASAWLQLGGIGPWRLPMQGDAGLPSASPQLIPNDETWLDFTDLVFLDPVGTGYSHSFLNNEETHHRFWSIDGDIDSLADVIRRWIADSERIDSPKYIVGESYGGFRGPRLARTLRTRQNIGVNGLVLMSPVLDFGRFNGAFNTLDWVAHLPSFAAAKLAEKGPVTADAMRDVEDYARGEYLADLMRGIDDVQAVERITRRVSALTGLDPSIVRILDGRIPANAFQREFDRRHGRVTSLYDATVTGFDPTPEAPMSRFADPILDALPPPLTGAMIDLYAEKLGWKLENTRYELINNSVNRSWEWGRGEPEAITDLRADLAIDPNFRVVIMHGYTDLVTPYFETKMLLDQIPAFGNRDRLRLRVYQGGHMQYIRDDSRAALRVDARQLIESK